MSALLRWTLWQRRWSIFWWTLGIAAFILINMIFYPTFRDQAGDLEKTFSQLSDSTKALFSDTGEFFSPVGYLSSQIFYLMMPMLAGILAIALGASLIGREEREGTLEFLLARPVSRSKLMAAKGAAGILVVLFVGLIGTAVTVIMARIVEVAVPIPNIILAGLAATALAASFGAIAFMITMLGRGARAASIGVAALMAILGYILASLSGTVDWLRWPAKLFPFYYYHSAEILRGTYNWYNMLFITGLIVLCGAVSWWAFRRRDIGA